MDSFQIMLADFSPWPWSAPSGVDHISPLCGALVDSDDLRDGSVPSHSRQSPDNAVADPSAIDLASSPASATAGPTSSGPILGRPRQWTVSRSRKLARLYLYSTLSIEKIIKVLEDDGFCPRKNSAQKAIHKMLDNDPRYLRPESRLAMARRIQSLAMSPTRGSRKNVTGRLHTALRHSSRERNYLFGSEVDSPVAQSIGVEDIPAFDFPAFPESFNLSYVQFPPADQTQDSATVPPEPENPASSPTAQELKRRLSDCSSRHALQLCAVIEDFTISDFSDDEGGSVGRPTSTPALSDTADLGFFQDLTLGTDAYEAFPDPGFALPGDFLTAHTRTCADFPGQEHGKNCWCSIARETSTIDNSWLLPTGEFSGRALHVLEHICLPGITSLHDGFGNVPLHLFAALQGCQEVLLQMVANQEGGSLRAVNTAGQTFLHVLNFEWFQDVASPFALLWRLLALINDTCPELVYQVDVYGRSFFHRAHSLIRDPATLSSLFSSFECTLAARRDAFGFNPVPYADPVSQGHYTPPRRVGSFCSSAEGLTRSASPASPPRSSTTDERCFLTYHTRLVQTIHSSYTNPAVEDADGRNGLHCLAEAILNQQTMDQHVQGGGGIQRAFSFTSITTGLPSTAPPARPHLKRKLSFSTDLSPSPSSIPDPCSAIPPPPPEEGPLPTRLRHLTSLLSPSISVSLSAYSRRGHTPLMSFIQHLPDAQDDRAKTLQTILETLIRRGGTRAVEARNRRGETPLLMAARLGRKIALATLLRTGSANVAARDADGRGVLELLDAEVKGARARGDVGLYARLEACRVLLTGRKEWGVRLAP
ncbi:KN motif and ankyrin repeat domain-containing protein 3 [Staphylotrichum tortipilum]|uniref:KN motif and ankyrin repeat domain-containing protein 3 n=1 Tax=Staphylotrichum tortipilum TaxID=2831512 RepID=A0AAN6MGV7_9PEZI|nr:KN motif and ankyrin repeat domain-containing protein 3 [Staphylotrichum longicolle]